MNIHIRKFHVFLTLALALTALLPVNTVQADAGGVLTPGDLEAAGWDCLYSPDGYAYCMNPAWQFGSPVIMNKTFLVSSPGPLWTDAQYLGSSIYMRGDKYAEQPCPTNSSVDWMWLDDIGYYNCRHFDQPYP